MSNRTQFMKIIRAHPELTTHGFGVDKDWNDSFETQRAKLQDCYEEFEVSRKYLASKPKFGKKRHSYGFKHDAEHWARENNLEPDYIPEGAFVAAVIGENLPYKRVKGTTHIVLK